YCGRESSAPPGSSAPPRHGTLSACKLRFGENNELSFGGFPGTSLIRS
ncbi:hypothetical protein ACUOA8_09315, partial [Escherichia sp. SS-MK2]